jgi:hypothetical protein
MLASLMALRDLVNIIGISGNFGLLWHVDSACSHHISPRQDLFIKGKLKPCHREVQVTNNQIEIAEQYGDVRIPWKNLKGPQIHDPASCLLHALNIPATSCRWVNSTR